MEIESQNQYKSTPVLIPKYRLEEVTRKGYGGDVTMSAGGGETLTYEMVPEPYNSGRSILAFDVSIALIANRYICVFAGGLPFFSEISFWGKGNKEMCKITNLDIFTRIMADSDHSFEELTMSDQDMPVYQICRDANFRNATGAGARYNADAGSPYLEKAYFTSSGVGVAYNVSFRIPFSYFKNTLLAEDKDVVYSDITNIKLTLNPKANVGFICSAIDAAKSNLGPISTDVILKNVRVYQAKETNEAINASLIASMNAGTQEINYSYVDCQNFTVTGANQKFYTKYSNSLGSVLKRVYWTRIPQALASINLRYNLDNSEGTLLTGFTTSWDSEPIHEGTIDCTPTGGNQDFLIMRPLLKGGAIQGKNIYLYNWFWCDNFGPEQVLHEHDSTKSGGIHLTNAEIKYEVKATTTNVANNYYVYAVIQRRLKSTRSGIELL